MRPLKAKTVTVDNDPENIRKAVQRLSFAYRRSAKQLESETDSEDIADDQIATDENEADAIDELNADSDLDIEIETETEADIEEAENSIDAADLNEDIEVDEITNPVENIDEAAEEDASQADLNLIAQTPLTEAAPVDQDEIMSDALRRAEAILFAAGQPLSAQQIAEVLPHGVDAPEVLMGLKAAYENRGVTLVEVAGRWRFQTSEDLSFLFVEERHEQKKLTQAALETLAIIAYGQPVTRAEIEAVRGVAVSKTTIDTLMETGWVRIKGRRKTPGRPVTLGTTDAFLEHFGLESLDVLPGKADLEAEGLLSDVVPEGFDTSGIIPEELDDIDDSLEDLADDTSFIMDFMDEEDEPGDSSED